jgi:hypothetical protein
MLYVSDGSQTDGGELIPRCLRSISGNRIPVLKWSVPHSALFDPMQCGVEMLLAQAKASDSTYTVHMKVRHLIKATITSVEPGTCRIDPY